MRDLLRTRSLLFFGGKGGVGKTTCAAAAALVAARHGRRVLLISTDPAHSTSDVLGMDLGSSPRGVSRHLDAVEIDPLAEARRYLDEVRDRIGRLFSPAVARQAAKQIDAAADTPGIEEAALLERLMTLVGARDRYDLTIVDTAPTGHTLRLLRMPETMGTWVSALVKARSAMADESKEPDPLLDALRLRMDRLHQWRRELTNQAAAAFVLVLTPERLPIEETVRAARELDSIGVSVGAIVANRVLPIEADGVFLEARREQERRYLADVDRLLGRFPIARVPQYAQDVHGIAALQLVGQALTRSGG